MKALLLSLLTSDAFLEQGETAVRDGVQPK